MVVSSQDRDAEQTNTVVENGSRVSPEEEKPTELLSTSQLILRRGLITLVALFILAAGVVVHLKVPLPEASYVANYTLYSNLTATTPVYSTIII